MNLIEKIKEVQVGQKVTTQDITLCFCIRVTNITPWIIDRLKFALNFYNPSPKVLVVDFGSPEPHKNTIENICREKNAKYIFTDDKDVYSNSKPRNIAFSSVESDFIFFADIDFVYESDIFSRLANIADRLNLKKNPKKVITMPIFHVGKQATQSFENTHSFEGKDRMIAKWSFDGLGTQFGTTFDFIAPYSNSFFMHTSMFSLAGGYCDEFRGHGSEDFDFMIRLAKIATNVPCPKNIDKDFYGPLKESFWGNKEYLGFRRFLEAFTLPSESLGLKAFHLWHEKPSHKGYWTQSNDWKREKFNSILNKYKEHDYKLLNIDYLKRDKKALCIFSDREQWGYFLPLRMAGYELHTLTEKSDAIISDVLHKIENGFYQSIFIFNPYMKSHSIFRGLIEIAKKMGVHVSVIERGGLPNSIYYADEVAYGDPEYLTIHDRLQQEPQCEKQLVITEKIIKDLRSGKKSLEEMDDYEKTWNKHALIRHINKNKIFIPLQLADDMAVNYFTEGHKSYSAYVSELKNAIKESSDKIFIIKQHPLSEYKLDWACEFENVVVAEQRDNIHALIELSDIVYLYNSGVGLLSLIHSKPLFHCGNAYYNANDNLATSVNSLNEAITKFDSGNYTRIDYNKIHKFFCWLIFSKYSWFNADDDIRSFEKRKAHGYKKISVEILNLYQQRFYTGSALDEYCYSDKSYLNWHLKVNSNNPTSKLNKPNTSYVKQINKDVNKKSTTKNTNHQELTITGSCLIPIMLPFLNERKRKKLINNPISFFNDSKYKASIFIRKLVIKQTPKIKIL